MMESGPAEGAIGAGSHPADMGADRMPRVALFAIVGLIYVGVVSLGLREEGRRYRRSIAVEAPASTVKESAPPAPVATSKPAASPPPKPYPRPVVVAKAASAPAPPTIAPPPTVSPKPAPASPPAVPGRPAAGAETLSEDDEREVGLQLYDRVMRVCRASADGPSRRRAQEALAPLLASRTRRGIGITLTILEADTINVFSHMGGYIYIDRGLFDLIGEDYELEFATARELAHVDRRHAARRVALAAADRPGIDLIRSAFHQIAAGYTPEQEAEADEWAYRQLIKAGRTNRQALAFLNRLVGYADKHGESAGRRKARSAPGDVNQDLDNHWKSAPAAVERLSRLKALGSQPPAPR